jgi:hypothetical protein
MLQQATYQQTPNSISRSNRQLRMVAPKSKRTDLSVPAWVGTEWNKGTKEKEQMATTLQEVNFDKAGPKSKPNFNNKLG